VVVSGIGKLVATGVVASVSLDTVEFGATLVDDVIVYTGDEVAVGDARITSEDDETKTSVNDGKELGDEDSELEGEEGREDSDEVSSELAGDEDCSDGDTGLVGREVDELSTLKPVSVALEVSDEEEGAVQVTAVGAVPYATKAGMLEELLTDVELEGVVTNASEVDSDRVSELAGDEGIGTVVATGVVSVKMDDELLELAAAGDTITGTYVEDDAAALVATGVLSVSTDVVSVDP
jgi:hypothetical protein